MKIGVLSICQYPKGFASSTRIIAYCGGLQKKGIRCELISYVLKDDKNGEDDLSGTISEGQYYHFAYVPNFKKGLCRIRVFAIIYRRCLNFYCKIKSIIHIFRSNKNFPFDYIILSFDNIWDLGFFVPILRVAKIKLCAIADEYPESYHHLRTSNLPKWKVILYRLVYRCIEKRILITESLQHFYDNQICKKPTLIVSTIVDIHRFMNVNQQEQNVEYLCYMGSLQLQKDNVDNIINAFALVSGKYDNLELRIYGIPNNNDQRILEELIRSLYLEDRIKLCGKVSFDEVPNVLCNAKILVMSQPQTSRSEGGFPTKVGEYLSSGVPAILTDVGEIKNYVADRMVGYLVKPCNPQAYADTIEEILNNYSNALQVARNAQKYVYDNFSSEMAGEKIYKFLYK